MHAARPPRRHAPFALILAPVLLVPATARGQTSVTISADLETRARAIHESVITIDTHDDISSNFATADSDPGQEEGRQVTLPKMRAGGLDVAFFIVYVGQRRNDAAGWLCRSAWPPARCCWLRVWSGR